MEAVDLGAHLAAQLGVEAREGLIEKKGRGVGDEGPGEGDALGLAARALARQFVQKGTICTISATSRTRRLRVSGSTFFIRGPNSMFSNTVLCGKRVWFWKTMPRLR